MEKKKRKSVLGFKIQHREIDDGGRRKERVKKEKKRKFI